MIGAKGILLAGLTLSFVYACSQMTTREHADHTAEAFARHAEYREAGLGNYRFTPEQVYALIDVYRDHELFEVEKLGESVEGRPIYGMYLGQGPREVLFWSQMHGDEPTATAALFDLYRFVTDPANRDRVEYWSERLTLRFIPMLNPDGAAAFTRRNAQGIDVNRDARRLQTPEGRILKAAVDRWQPDFGFNLHDQHRFHSAAAPDKPATLSFLAPAFDAEKSVDAVRERAMRLTALLNRDLQPLIPGQIGRYDDTWEPRAFGDNIQGWGTSAILVESGGSPDDPGRELPRQLNFALMLASIEAIAAGTYRNVDLAHYESIPFNRTRLFDLLIRGVSVPLAGGGSYLTDIGINYSGRHLTPHPQDDPRRAILKDWGDLSTFAAYEELDAAGLTLSLPDCAPGETCAVDPVALHGKLDFDLRENGVLRYRVRRGVPERIGE